MVVSPAKSKIMLATSKELRRMRVHGQPQGVMVQGKLVLPTRSERPLGLNQDKYLT